jgi:hypothetical protein
VSKLDLEPKPDSVRRADECHRTVSIVTGAHVNRGLTGVVGVTT